MYFHIPKTPNLGCFSDSDIAQKACLRKRVFNSPFWETRKKGMSKAQSRYEWRVKNAQNLISRIPCFIH